METNFEAAQMQADRHPANKVLRLIAVFKFVEAAVIIAAAFAALKLLDPTTLKTLAAWTEALPAISEQNLAKRVLNHLSGITPREVKEIGIGGFLFAAIFLVEGVGLWLERRWAEWLSVLATSVFIPLELLELFRHASLPKLIALVLNSLVVAYLIFRIQSAKPARLK